MVEEVKYIEMFDRRKSYDAIRKKPPPIEHLVLVILIVLGWAWYLDDP